MDAEIQTYDTIAKLITAATPVLVPVIVAWGKALLPRVPKLLLPLVAILLGGLIDVLNVYVISGEGVGLGWGAVLGAAGVGFREVLDQLLKAAKGLKQELPPDLVR